MLIAVSGNIGSGKSTFATYLSKYYNLSYVPQKRLEFNFLDDFFEDIENLFLPVQLSFLISKAIEIQNLVKEGKNVVLDRSLLEDISVFARLWIESKKINKEIVKLYQSTAKFICQALPRPDLYIFCQCSASTSKERISHREKRSFETHYPPNHIERLEKYYNDFLSSLDAPCVEIDTEHYNFTSEKTLQNLCNIIFDSSENSPYHHQLSFFEDNTEDYRFSGLKFHHFTSEHPFFPGFLLRKSSPYIYLAAPFTQMANNNDKKAVQKKRTDNFLIEDKPLSSYGVLDTSYQNQLKKIEEAIIEHCQMNVHLPHRDINNWGKTKHPTEYITPRIVSEVESATAIVAIPGNSVGVHLELGIGIARRIPIIIFATKEFENSFFVDGFERLPFIKLIQANSLSQIPSMISTEKILEFISRNHL